MHLCVVLVIPLARHPFPFVRKLPFDTDRWLLWKPTSLNRQVAVERWEEASVREVGKSTELKEYEILM